MTYGVVIGGRGFTISLVDEEDDAMEDYYVPVIFREETGCFLSIDTCSRTVPPEEFEENLLYWNTDDSPLLFKLRGKYYKYEYDDDFNETLIEKKVSELIQEGQLDLLEIFKIVAL